MAENTRLDLKEAAERSGRSMTVLRSWIRDGRLPAIKEDKQYFVLPDELDAAVALFDKETEQAKQEMARRTVAGWPPLSPERRDELSRILATPEMSPVTPPPVVPISKSELKEWAQREAAKAPPFRPEQLNIVVSSFRSSLEKQIREDQQ